MMFKRLAAMLQALWGDVVAEEREHRFYGRALAWTVWALLVAMLLVGKGMHQPAPLADPACRTAPQSATGALDLVGLELASDAAGVRALLFGKAVFPPVQTAAPADAGSANPHSMAGNPHYIAERCSALRAQDYRSALDTDGGLFVPLYVLITMAALGWVLMVSLHCADAQRRRVRLTRGQRLVMGLSVLVVLLTAGLDARENQATRVVLDAVTGTGALNDVVLPRWQPLVDAMRQASLWKWLASGGWAALLCALAWTQRHALATPRRGVLGCMLAVLLVAGLVLLGAAAAVCLVGGALAGLAASAASASDQTMVALATARRAVQWGFVLALGYPLVLALLTLLHRRNPARRG